MEPLGIPPEVLLPVLLSAVLGLVWLVRLEARGVSNSRGVQRSDDHIREGQDVKVDIGILKNDVAHNTEDQREIKDDIREIKRMMAEGCHHENH